MNLEVADLSWNIVDLFKRYLFYFLFFLSQSQNNMQIKKIQFKNNIYTECFTFNVSIMEGDLINSELSIDVVPENGLVKKANNKRRSNKCKQCDFTSSDKSDVRTHLKKHSVEKSNKCNQCDFASSYPSSLRKHMKRHRSV